MHPVSISNMEIALQELSNPNPTTPSVSSCATEESSNTRSKYVSNRRNSLAAAFGDDDDMRDEIEKLNIAQSELQAELASVMKMVELMHRSSNGDDFDESFVSNASLNSSSHNNIQVVEDVSPKKTRKSFAEGFFELMVPESLEAQKRRQMEILKENLKDIDPDLPDFVECQSEMQNIFVQKQQQLEEFKAKREQQLQRLRHKRTSTLEEEKKKQLEILRLDLQSIDPALENAMADQIKIQGEIVAKKKEELEKIKEMVDEKLKELNVGNQKDEFWVSTRRHLEKMMSFKDKKPTKVVS